MGYKEIAMIVMGLVLAGILALAIAPSISASADATKASMIVNEIKSIEFATKMWAVNNSATADLTGLSANQIKAYIPNLKFADPYLFSKIGAVKYHIRQEDWVYPNSFRVTVYGVVSIYYSRTAIVEQLKDIYGENSVTDSGNDFLVRIRE